MEFNGRGERRVSVLSDRHSLKENLKWRRQPPRSRLFRVENKNPHFPHSSLGELWWLSDRSAKSLPLPSRRRLEFNVNCTHISRWPWMGRWWNLCKVETCGRKWVTWNWALGFLGHLHLHFLFTLCFVRVDKIGSAQSTSRSSHHPFPPWSSQNGFYLSETVSPKMLLELLFSRVFTSLECNQDDARAGFALLWHQLYWVALLTNKMKLNVRAYLQRPGHDMSRACDRQPACPDLLCTTHFRKPRCLDRMSPFRRAQLIKN